VKNHQQLKELLRVASGGVIFIITQKFQPEEGTCMKRFRIVATSWQLR